ncbi:MAG: hypothetical protein ACLFQK_06950, partial [Fibrobacterota bacterium]
LNPSNAVIEFEEEKGVYHRAYIYLIKSDGKERVEKVSTYSVPVYKWFDKNQNQSGLYEKIEIYFNGKRGSNPFNTGYMKVKYSKASKSAIRAAGNTGKNADNVVLTEESGAEKVGENAAETPLNPNRVRNILYILVAAGTIISYLLVRMVYKPNSSRFANSRVLFLFSGTRVFYTSISLAWIAVVYGIWKSPLVPGSELSDLGILMISFAPIILFVIEPLQLDRKYKKCGNCKRFVSPEFIEKHNLGSSGTKYTANLGDQKLDAGSESHSYGADHFVCPECGEDMSRYYSIHSGGKKDVSIGNDGKMSTDIMNTNGLINLAFNLAQPYNWYRFYRGIGLLK